MSWRAPRFLPALVVLGAPVAAQPEEEQPVEEATSPFVGRYDGSGMEVAMGMVIRPDGTFEWGLSVGALDMRAQGTWEQTGERIFFTSSPKPVAPEFAFSGLETREDAPWLRIVWSGNAKPFPYGEAFVTCRNGWKGVEHVPRDGFPSDVPQQEDAPDVDVYPNDDYPDESPSVRELCDEPATVQLRQSSYQVRSPVYDLRALGWTPGQTARFEFRRNDLGVADFTGVNGHLEGDRIVLDTHSLSRQDMPGSLEMRRLRAVAE